MSEGVYRPGRVPRNHKRVEFGVSSPLNACEKKEVDAINFQQKSQRNNIFNVSASDDERYGR